jgi:hypothetical protein
VLFRRSDKSTFSSHKIEKRSGGIVVKLAKPYIINCLRMRLFDLGSI